MTTVAPPKGVDLNNAAVIGPPWDPTYLVKRPDGNIKIVGSDRAIATVCRTTAKPVPSKRKVTVR